MRLAGMTWCTAITGCPARSAPWLRSGGVSRWCSRCTRWGRSRTPRWQLGDAAEPEVRLRGEAEVVACADRLVANTDDEARQLIGHYDADPARVTTINPGVDLAVFRPGSQLEARRQLGLPADGVVLVFAGRVQPLKAPDVVLHTAAQLIADDPGLAGRLTVAFVGGPSGTGRQDPDGLTAAGEPARPGRPSSGSSRPARSRSWPSGTGPPPSSWCRRTPSPSGWSPWRHRPAARRWSPQRSAACAPRCGTAYSGILVDSRDPGHYARAVRELIARAGQPGPAGARRQGARQPVRLVGDGRLPAAALCDGHRRGRRGGRRVSLADPRRGARRRAG